ncbi:hypothetical protein [Gallaecimonas xiamenensis]|uniref:Uncharacterized protein n=1 Tax=Gallaecimonas xiamenensis 3-C-1 TaxID=745411 RepID=K2K2B1_9GAMM|nr:hypothetical protein [Gallaecimonas xiamenensis]EKE71615.1 hypothetical protein B3C1_11789 [Gallaecimonas xiamenensis 3-C-1]
MSVVVKGELSGSYRWADDVPSMMGFGVGTLRLFLTNHSATGKLVLAKGDKEAVGIKAQALQNGGCLLANEAALKIKDIHLLSSHKVTK